MLETKFAKYVLASAVILPQLRTGAIARKRGYHSLCWILAAWPVAIPMLLLAPNLRLQAGRSDLVSWRLALDAIGLTLSAVTVSILSLVAYNLPAVLEMVGLL
jgi:hypothetical protein